jgi:hypothetical protein
MENLAYIFVSGNEPGKRIGIVKWFETGYYATDFDHHQSEEAAREHVRILNYRLGIPEDVAKAALYGSMFGWHVPAAQPAVRFAPEPVMVVNQQTGLAQPMTNELADQIADE